MPTLEKVAATEAESVELSYVKQRIAAEIIRRYNMSVYEFSRSDECKKLGIDGKNLSIYLSNGSNSISVLAQCYQAFGLGKLTRTEVRVVTYHVQPVKSK